MSAESIQRVIPPKLMTTKLAVSFRLLLGLYLVIPICLVISLIDTLFLNGAIRDTLPSSPKHFLLLQVLLGTPHILASAILLSTNNDYLRFYKTKLIGMTVAIIALFGFGSLVIPYRILYLIVAIWTVFHVLKQQHGIARGICRLTDKPFYSLLGLSVAAGIMVYVGIFMKNNLNPEQAQLIWSISAILSALLVIATIFCQRYVTTGFGKSFLWANTLLVLSSFYLYSQEYYFLAILVPRLVHDATAYVFYITHDYNRHHQQPQNFIYRAAKRCNLHLFVVLPLITFLLTFILQQYGDAFFNLLINHIFGFEVRKAISLGLLGYFALMHYYTEAFTWKGDSPYRQFIAFKS